jgi:hypothetical protein
MRTAAYVGWQPFSRMSTAKKVLEFRSHMQQRDTGQYC